MSTAAQGPGSKAENYNSLTHHPRPVSLASVISPGSRRSASPKEVRRKEPCSDVRAKGNGLEGELS